MRAPQGQWSQKDNGLEWRNQKQIRDQFGDIQNAHELNFRLGQFGGFKKELLMSNYLPKTENMSLTEWAKLAESKQICSLQAKYENPEEDYQLTVTEKIDRIKLQIKQILQAQDTLLKENYQKRTKDNFMKKIEQLKKLIEEKEEQEKKALERSYQQKKEEINEFLNFYLTLISRDNQKTLDFRNSFEFLQMKKIESNSSDNSCLDEQLGQMKKTIKQRMKRLANMADLYSESQLIPFSADQKNVGTQIKMVKKKISDFEHFDEENQAITLLSENIIEGSSNYRPIFLSSWKKEGNILQFETHITKTKNRHIKIGVLDKNSTNHVRHSVWFKGSDGTIFLGNSYSNFYFQGNGFLEKQTVLTQVNFRTGKITWLVDNQEKASMQAPILTESNRQFVPYWQMMDEGDIIQWELV